MNDSIRRLFELDEAIWTPGDLPEVQEWKNKDYWVALANSQLNEICQASLEHEGKEWADLFLVALHHLRSEYHGYWPDRVYERLQNHAHKGINHIKEKYGQTA